MKCIVEPVYEPCADAAGFHCYIPALGSPLIDAGRHPPLACFPLPCTVPWSLPQHDLLGRSRIDDAGQRVDIGAYENHDRFFADRFEE